MYFQQEYLVTCIQIKCFFPTGKPSISFQLSSLASNVICKMIYQSFIFTRLDSTTKNLYLCRFHFLPLDLQWTKITSCCLLSYYSKFLNILFRLNDMPPKGRRQIDRQKERQKDIPPDENAELCFSLCMANETTEKVQISDCDRSQIIFIIGILSHFYTN